MCVCVIERARNRVKTGEEVAVGRRASRRYEWTCVVAGPGFRDAVAAGGVGGGEHGWHTQMTMAVMMAHGRNDDTW